MSLRNEVPVCISTSGATTATPPFVRSTNEQLKLFKLQEGGRGEDTESHEFAFVRKTLMDINFDCGSQKWKGPGMEL